MEILKGRGHSEDLGIKLEDIKSNVYEIGQDSVDWGHLAKGTDEWQAIVNMIINDGKFTDEPGDYKLLKKGPAHWSW